MKQIVYLAVDNGIDGLSKTNVLYAAFTEVERDAMIEADKSKAWRSKKEVIVDPAVARNQALAKLDGIDRLVLGLPAWPNTVVKATPTQPGPTYPPDVVEAIRWLHRLSDDANYKDRLGALSNWFNERSLGDLT